MKSEKVGGLLPPKAFSCERRGTALAVDEEQGRKSLPCGRSKPLPYEKPLHFYKRTVGDAGPYSTSRGENGYPARDSRFI
ncbi:MAG: hypothetical protein ACI3XX_02350 [Eubacteriales bacterium]